MSASKLMPYWGAWQEGNIFLSVGSRGIYRKNSSHIEHAEGITLRGIAQCLDARGFKTPMGRLFTRQTVARTLRRLA